MPIFYSLIQRFRIVFMIGGISFFVITCVDPKREVNDSTQTNSENQSMNDMVLDSSDSIVSQMMSDMLQDHDESVSQQDDQGEIALMDASPQSDMNMTPITDAQVIPDSSEETGGSEEDMTVEDAPTFESLFQRIFIEAGCSAGYCHGAGQGGLMIAEIQASYDSLINADAMTPSCGLTKRVVPGEPEQSILWFRVRHTSMDEGNEPCAPKMPSGSEGLSPENAELIYQWIAGGLYVESVLHQSELHRFVHFDDFFVGMWRRDRQNFR